MRFLRISFWLALAVAGLPKIESQGRINFANVADGTSVPITRNGAPVERGCKVQLEVRGVNGNFIYLDPPATVLNDGLFSAGIRIVPGIEGGTSVLARVVVLGKGFAAYSDCWELTLSGGDGDPQPPPAFLMSWAKGMTPQPTIDIGIPPTLTYQQTANDKLMITWPSAYNLISSPFLNRPSQRKRVTPNATDGCTSIVEVPIVEPQRFYWIE